MKLVVTGVAGFIGSQLAEKALNEGHSVVGIDCFTDYYSRSIKEQNLSNLKNYPEFSFVETNIVEIDLVPFFKEADVVYHLAAQAGVRASWGEQFRIYSDYNVLGTQCVLEAAKTAGVQRVVYASSSSVYGDVDVFPMKETHTPHPVSPYGVSKLAGEHLCVLYYKNFKLSTVSLRYFTVYGPRQRPDMAFNKIIRAALTGKTFELYGTGDQTRDFTYVSDAVDATFKAGFAPDVSGKVFNIGGGSRISMNNVLQILEDVMGKPISVERTETQKGDVRHTAADTSKAKKYLTFQPEIQLADGLRKEVQWLEMQYNKEGLV